MMMVRGAAVAEIIGVTEVGVEGELGARTARGVEGLGVRCLGHVVVLRGGDGDAGFLVGIG